MSELQVPEGFRYLPFDGSRQGVCRGCGNSLKRCPKGAVEHLECSAVVRIRRPVPAAAPSRPPCVERVWCSSGAGRGALLVRPVTAPGRIL